MTLLNIHPRDPEPLKLARVVNCLREGGIIIYPTDTIYSFGCDIHNSRAIEKLARMKGTRVDKARFSIICHDLADVAAYSRQLENHVFKMMKSLLPGPYTFILDAGKNIPKIFSERKKTIGVRVPDHEVPLRLVRLLGNPIVSTSVHDEDEMLEYTSEPELMFERYKNDVDLVIDSGPSGLEASSVILCSGGKIEWVRQGKGAEQAAPWIQ